MKSNNISKIKKNVTKLIYYMWKSSDDIFIEIFDN